MRDPETALLVEDLRYPVAPREGKVRPIQRLTVKHRRIVALHLTGKHSNVQVAKMLGISPATVSAVLRNPAVSSILQRSKESMDMELESMFALAIERLRKILLHGDDKTAMTAVDKVLRVLGKFDAPEERTRDTAEDVIKRILEIRSEGPVEIRMGEEVRR